jgi:hypothetical protein
VARNPEAFRVPLQTTSIPYRLAAEKHYSAATVDVTNAPLSSETLFDAVADYVNAMAS